MRSRLCIVIASIVSLVLIVCGAEAGSNPCAGKKLIEYGWDCPTPQFVKANIKKMEEAPFDGVVIRIPRMREIRKRQESIGRRAFSEIRFKPEEYEHAIEDLKAVKFNRFTDNFIQVLSSPGVDWFSDNWSTCAYNAACLAKVAKQTGCKGIMLDVEQYGPWPTWGYKGLPENLKSAHTFEEYQVKVRERGREFIKALDAEYPDITILALFGPSLTYTHSRSGSIEDSDYALLASFFDGMCEAASPGTKIIDGFEFSYAYRIHEAFVEGRRVMAASKSISACPEEFSQHMRVGFGVWADNNSGRLGWHPEDLTKNYFTSAGLRASLNYALRETDEYVWVYSERFSWWEGTAPREFVEALGLAKLGPGKGHIPASPIPKASEQPGYADSETFHKLGSSLRELYDFPKTGWKFKRDSTRVGEKDGWFRADYNDSKWKPVSIGKFWEEEHGHYDGTAWYRLKFTAPEFNPNERIYLAFGAVDESAAVWINGESAGIHDIGDIGWNVPFVLDVTGKLKPGTQNTIAVKVFDITGGGGIWKSVKLMH